MFTQQRELDEGDIDFAAAPLVEADDHLVDGEQKVVIRLLQGLGDRVKLTFVRAAVVGLRLAGHRPDKVAVHAHSEAEHVHRLLYVGGPVAALLVVGVNLVDDDLVLNLACGRDIECGEPHLASVLNASEEVEDLLLLAHDAFLLLVAVGDALALEDGIPILVGDFYLVLDGGDILQLRLFRHADELLDVVPLALEQRCVVRDGVISAVGCGNTCQHGKLPARGSDGGPAVVARYPAHADGEVAPRRVDVEQFDDLDVLTAAHRLAPVGVEDVADGAVSLRRREPAVASLLADKPHNLRAVGIEDDDRDAEGEVLEVLADTEEIRGQGVVEQEVLDLLLDARRTLVGVVFKAAAVAHFGVEHLTRRERFIVLDEFEDIVGHGVVAAPWHIGQRVVNDSRHDVRVFLEDLAAVNLKRSTRVQAGDGFYTIKI